MLLDGEESNYDKRVAEIIFYFFNLQTHYPTVPLVSPGPSNPLSKTELIFYLKKKTTTGFHPLKQELTRLIRPELYPGLQPQEKTKFP